MIRIRSANRVRWRRRPLTLRTRLLVLVAGGVICWTVLGFALQYFRTYTLARESSRLERRRHDLLAQNATLVAEIERLRTDDQYLERLARGQLGMLRPGELEMVIVPAEPARHLTEHDTAKSEVAQQAEGLAQSFGRVVRDATQAVRTVLERLLSRLPRAAP